MKLSINNEETEVSDQLSTLQLLLESKEISNKKGIAIALNDHVIAKTDWRNTALKDRDKILIITATQGG